MRRPILGGNWKMNKDLGQALAYASAFKEAVLGVDDADIVIFPPSVYIEKLSEAFKGSPVATGVQNLFWEEKGAFTGELSTSMVKSVGATYVLIGHSERRQYFSETNETVNKRLKAVLKAGLIPMLCVGERLEEREANETFSVIEKQLKEGLAGLSKDDAKKLTVAYEPVWAIGTGKTATPAIAQEVHGHIRGLLNSLFGKEIGESIRLAYGGSVTQENIDNLMAEKDIDGALVGGASLDPVSFERIVRFRRK
jgi:triosephosphate isomerase